MAVIRSQPRIRPGQRHIGGGGVVKGVGVWRVERYASSTESSAVSADRRAARHGPSPVCQGPGRPTTLGATESGSGVLVPAAAENPLGTGELLRQVGCPRRTTGGQLVHPAEYPLALWHPSPGAHDPLAPPPHEQQARAEAPGPALGPDGRYIEA